MYDEQQHSPRSALRVIRAWLTALRERTRRGAATVGHRARHSVEAARERAGVVRHRIDRVGPRGRRAVVIAAAVVGVVLAGTAAGAVLVDGDSTDRAQRVAAPTDDNTLLRRDGDRSDRLNRESVPSDEPGATSPTPTGTPDTPRPSPSRSAEAESDDAKDEERKEADKRQEEAEKAEKKKEESRPAETPDWVHPMPGAVTTSCFGPRWGTVHQGVDLALPAGTPIRAVGAGTVVYAGWVFSGYGISVVIDHHNGYLTHYAHASEVTVSVGQTVKPGQTIALEGSTGDSTGPHLHFEVHQGMWNQIEPTGWMRERGVVIDGC